MRLVDLIAPPVVAERLADDIVLHEAAGALHELPSSRKALREMLAAHGLGLATAALYRYFREARDAATCRHIDALPAASFRCSGTSKLVIVPGMFHAEHPELGGDGSLIAEIAARVGFEVSVVPTRSKGSIGVNAGIVAQHLAKEKSRDIWLVSLSRGSAEVLQYLRDAGANAGNVRGWISIFGIVSGTHLADLKLNNPLKRAWYRLLCALAGIEYRLLQELGKTHSLWSASNFPASGFPVLHVVGMPLSGHVARRLHGKFRWLAQHGPNDGVVSLEDYLDLPGHVYPVWGVDHFGRFREATALVYRLCRYIDSSAREGDTQ